ncbi:MAG: CRISPR-associated protein Cas4 [Candidatus Heimdallarchaeota archaeon]
MTLQEFTAEDFRQYNYCSRIIYFRYVFRIQPKRTYKMLKGQEYHDEKIRRKTQSKRENRTIHYNKFIAIKDLGLSALFDVIVEERGVYYPIEYKTGKSYPKIPYHHLIQLIVQAIILDSYYNTNVEKGEIRYGSEKRLETPITLKDKLAVLKQHTAMLQIVLNETMPSPTAHEGKCHDCEFWLMCRRA